jgi:hypothetical protein
LKVEERLLPQYVHPLVAIEVGLDECQAPASSSVSKASTYR